MFSETEFAFIKFILTKTTRLVTSPFDFNGKRLSSTRHKYKAYCKGIHILLLVANTVLLAFKFPSTLDEKKFINIILHGIYLVGSLSLLLYEASITLFRDEVAAFFNQTVNFNQDSGRLN
jgi:hypothetical protein